VPGGTKSRELAGLRGETEGRQDWAAGPAPPTGVDTPVTGGEEAKGKGKKKLKCAEEKTGSGDRGE